METVKKGIGRRERKAEQSFIGNGMLRQAFACFLLFLIYNWAEDGNIDLGDVAVYRKGMLLEESTAFTKILASSGLWKVSE